MVPQKISCVRNYGIPESRLFLEFFLEVTRRVTYYTTSKIDAPLIPPRWTRGSGQVVYLLCDPSVEQILCSQVTFVSSVVDDDCCLVSVSSVYIFLTW